ncbi:MAG: VanZ family protein [Clostridia bacterium]|nr:VanZ family protein [Clostridia bacterium]
MLKKSKICLLLCRIAYIALLAVFLIESALPPEVSFKHTVPLAGLFTKAKMRPELVADDGEGIGRHTLTFDSSRGVGEVIRLVPEGAEKITSVVCDTEGVIDITEYRTDTQGVFYLARATGVGSTKLTLTGVSGEVTRERTVTVSTKSGDIPTGGGFSGASVPSDMLYVGQTLSVGLIGDATPDDYGTVIWTSTDEDILKVTSWSYGRAEATLTATGAGSVKIRARRLYEDELLYEGEITVLDSTAKTDLAIEGAGGGEIPASLAYDSQRGLGECAYIRLLGDTEATVSVTGEAIRIDRTDNGFRAVAVGVGGSQITVSSSALMQTLTLDLTVTEGEFAPAQALTLSPDRIREGDLFTVEYGSQLPFDIYFEGEGLQILEGTSGAVRIKAGSAGEYLLVAKNPSHGVKLAEVRVSVDEAPRRVEFIEVYSVVRKSVGHLAFCAALGFLFKLSFGVASRRGYLIACISNATLVSVITELIQLIVGRKCALTDMLINAVGFALGLAIASGIIYFANYLLKRGIKNDTGK